MTWESYLTRHSRTLPIPGLPLVGPAAERTPARLGYRRQVVELETGGRQPIRVSLRPFLLRGVRKASEFSSARRLRLLQLCVSARLRSNPQPRSVSYVCICPEAHQSSVPRLEF